VVVVVRVKGGSTLSGGCCGAEQRRIGCCRSTSVGIEAGVVGEGVVVVGCGRDTDVMRMKVDWV
jgi:hypothetical protein